MEKYSKLLIDSFYQTLRYDNLDIHIVLYSTKYSIIYQFDPINFKVKLMNSILWNNLNKDELYSFYIYMLYKYTSIVGDFEEKSQSLGNLFGSIYYIDLDTFANIIENDIASIFRINVINKNGVIEEFKEFYKTIKNIYTEGGFTK